VAANVIQFTVRGKDENTKSVFGAIAKGIAGVAAALGSFVSAKEIGRTIVSFEKLRLSVNTVSDSAKNAEKNMAFIQDFAATTPFQLDEVTESFIKMKALGLDPSEEALQSYGDTASAMGKSMLQIVDAVADATVGEFERLKEFGIRSRNEGDTIKFTFKGITTSVANNATAIEAHLQSLGRVNFSGAMQTQANSVVGAVSNMGDTFTALAVSLGDAGLRPLIRSIAILITKMMKVIIDNQDTVRAFIKGIVTVFLIMKQVFMTVGKAIKALFDQDIRSAITSILDTFDRVGSILMDWAAQVIPAIGRIFLVGFPIILAGLVSIFIETFSNIGRLIGDIIVLALTSLFVVFKEFGASVNDMLQNAILGIADDRSFSDVLKERFTGAFTRSDEDHRQRRQGDRPASRGWYCRNDESVI